MVQVMDECATEAKIAAWDGDPDRAYRFARSAGICAREVQRRTGQSVGRVSMATWHRVFERLESLGCWP